MKKRLMNQFSIGMLIIVSGINCIFARGLTINKIGIGLEFHAYPSVFMVEGAFQEGYGLGLYLPIEFSGLMIEPQVSYFDQQIEVDYDDSQYGDDYKTQVSYTQLTIGIFMLTKGREKTRLYGGIRIGKSWSKYDIGNDSEIDDNLILSPTIGAEFYFTETFSFGGEGQLYIIVDKDDGVHYEKKTRTTVVIPKFIARFYF